MAAWNKGITIHKPKLCLCGCGKFVKVHKYTKKQGRGFTYVTNNFIKGHSRRGIGGFNTQIHNPRLCACGCGKITQKFRGCFNRFIKGHENINRVPWNKGKIFSETTRRKMSLARIGKEPSNKIYIDLEKLHKLYVQEMKNISVVSKELNVSINAIKNRIQTLGWSRSTKESCSTNMFKEKMRQIRIKTLTSQKMIEMPNKLERLVYKSIDKFDILYKKQVPLFGKFVVDAFFPEKLLVLEIFGRYWHDKPAVKKKDFSKKKYLEKCGYKVEELWDDEIKRNDINLLLQNIFRKHNLI